jgi:flagellar basal-body rod protein FlgF
MDKLVYTALSGLRGRLSAQAAIANNIANATTTGFKAEKFDFDTRTLVQGSAQLQSRAEAGEQVLDADRSAGAIVQTGRKLDVALNGEAWLAVQGDDGQEAYTRRGDLSVTDSGLLVNGEGAAVLGSGGSPITVPPNDGMSITADGSVTIVPPGGKADQPQVLDRLKLVSTEGSQTVKGLDNLLHVKGGGTLPEDLNATVTAGALEQSNVNMAQALIDMIENQRSYEVSAKMLSTTKDIDEGGASIMRVQA